MQFMQFWAYVTLHQFSAALKDTAESSLPVNEEDFKIQVTQERRKPQENET
jgi:hypothetical protein